MTPNRLAALAAAVLIALTGCASTSSGKTLRPPVHKPSGCCTPSQSSSPTAPPTTPPPTGLLVVADEGHVSQTLHLDAGQCAARDSGRLPDPACTPGAIDPAVTQATIHATICVRGWTATVRPPAADTGAFKHDVAFPAYSVPAGTEAELDHLVPLELGGANDSANLWPEVGPIPNAKDPVENDLRAAVCAGQVTLAAARQAIATDWETALAALGVTPGIGASGPDR